MSRFSGKYAEGAMKDVRKRKRAEASERNAKTPMERTAWYRRQKDQDAFTG